MAIGRTKSDAESEVMWLNALALDTQIPVPRIVPASDGRGITTPDVDGVPTGHHALLMTWLPGVLLGKRLTIANLTKMGELFAQMHDHGASWQPPAGFTNRRFDNFMSARRGRPVPDR